MKKQRIVSLDWLRCFAFFLIIAYHFMFHLETIGSYSYANWKINYANANMHIGTLGAELFFILSGFGLVLSSDKREIDLKEYFKKRFFKILLPFYITYLLFLIYTRIVTGSNPFASGIAAWRIVFTVFGMDGYASMMKISTYSLGIGEWFLGCLMLMYILYPLLYKILLRAPYTLLCLAVFVYGYIVFDYHYTISVHINFFVKLFEFILGMYLATVYEKIPKWVILPSAFITSIFLVSKDVIRLPDGFKFTLISVSIFLLFLLANESCAKLPYVQKPIRLLSDYSYELFLVHHIIIYEIGNRLVAGRLLSTKRMLALAIIEFVIMIVLAVLVRLASRRISSSIQKLHVIKR